MSGHNVKRKILAGVSGKRKVFHPLYPVLILGVLLFPVLSAFGEDWDKQGMNYLKSKQYKDAVKAFSNAIEIDPGKADAYFHRGSSWFQLGEFDQAIADFSSALDINPQDPDAYVSRGAAWYMKGNYGKAVADATKALAMTPGSAEIYNNRGSALFQAGDPSRAVADFTRALDIDPGYGTAYINRGLARVLQGDYDQAIADFSSVLNIDPDNVVAYVNRGTALFKKGDYDRAIDDYNEALDIDPRNADAYNEFAWLLATCPNDTYRDGDRAVVFAKKAVELKPGVPTLDTLAAAYAEAGKFSDAIEAQLGVISLKNKEGNPGDLGKYIERLESYSSHRVLGENGPVPGDIKSQQPGLKKIEASVANIRSRPSTSASIVAKLRAGEEVTILHRDNDWYAVQLPGKRLGWAHKTLFLKTE